MSNTSNFLGFGTVLLALTTLVGCADKEVGTKQRPFSMYFIPSVDAEDIASESAIMEKFLEKRISQELYGKDTGFYVKTSVPTSYVSVVEAFGTNKADFAAFTTFAYILAKDVKKYPVEALFTIARGPNAEEHTYKSQFITRADSGIKNLKDLAGKKFAYTDPASTSGYILPSKMLEDKGIKLGGSVFAQKHDNVVTMVYQGQVDAGATYYSPPEVLQKDGKQVSEIRDARYRVQTQFPDVEEKVKIIGFSEEVPNEPWVVRTNLYKDEAKNKQVKEALKTAILEFIQTKDGKNALWTVSTATGLFPTTSDTYSRVRQLILESGADVQAILEKGK